MSRAGRKLSPDEAEIWAKVAKTVVPLRSATVPAHVDDAAHEDLVAASTAKQRPAPVAAPRTRAAPVSSPSTAPAHTQGLDNSWNRRLSRGISEPDFTLDLHGCTLDQAHSRLIHGLSQAKAMGARLVLLITGKPRPVDAADRGQRRGAIRAKAIDWLAASEHALDIAAIRGAHRRHGGAGALYVVLKRKR